MPVMLFYNIYSSDFSHAVRLPYALFVVGMALAMILLAFLITLAAEKTPERRGVMIQAAFRSNFVLLGCLLPRSCCQTPTSALPP